MRKAVVSRSTWTYEVPMDHRISNVVRELCAGKRFEFTSTGDATLKGFDKPVALYGARVS
jgi:hypothetical protein